MPVPAKMSQISNQLSVLSLKHQHQLEDDPKFDEATRDLIKTVYQSYMEHMRPEILTDKSLITPDNQSSTFHEILAYLSFYMRQYIKFLENIPEFNKLTVNDREELIRGSIHSVITLAIYRGCDPTRVNYFNVDSDKFDKFIKLFPCFESSCMFMRKIGEQLKEYRLDDKEIALLIGTMSFITSSKNFEDYETISEMRVTLGNALRIYMSIRRNEEIDEVNEINDAIILTLPVFKRFNNKLQNELTNQYATNRELNQLNDQCLLIEKLLMTSLEKKFNN